MLLKSCDYWQVVQEKEDIEKTYPCLQLIQLLPLKYGVELTQYEVFPWLAF